MTSAASSADATNNRSRFDGARETQSSQPSNRCFPFNLFKAHPVHPGRAASHASTEPLREPSQRSYLPRVSAMFAHKRISEPTFKDLANLAADCSLLFQKQVEHRNSKKRGHPEIAPTLAKDFCVEIVSKPRHCEVIRYIVDSVAQGKTIDDVVNEFKKQNEDIEKNQSDASLPFPKSVLPFVEIALTSVFRELPTAESIKNTQADIRESSDDAAHKFVASIWADISHKTVSLGMRLTNACFNVFGVKATLYIGSWFVPGMIKGIVNRVIPEKAKSIDSKNPPEATLHDAAQYVLSAFSNLRSIKSALEGAQTPAGVSAAQSLREKEMTDIVNELWAFTGDLMSATDGTVDITKGQYKGWQLLEDNTVITTDGKILEDSKNIPQEFLSEAEKLRETTIVERREAMLKVFKNNIPFLRRIFQSENPGALVDAILKNSVLPENLVALVKDQTKIIFESNDLTALMKSLLKVENGVVLPKAKQEAEKKAENAENVPPETDAEKRIREQKEAEKAKVETAAKKLQEQVETGMGQLLDLLPKDQLDDIANLFTKTLQEFKPNDIPYFRTFKKELVGSLKSSERVKSLSEVAEVLTENYFSAIPIHKKRVMACAILSEGRPEFKDANDPSQLTDESKTKFILAMTNKGGIGFQKAMQLFGDSVKDPVMSKALASMKDSVKALDAQWAINKYKTELMEINKKSWASAKIDSEYAQYTVVDGSFNATPLKAATVGQVHAARVNITYHTRGTTPPTEDKKNQTVVTHDPLVVVKDKKTNVEKVKIENNKPVILKLLRENAAREVSVEMNALMSLQVVEKNPSVMGTLEGVQEGILEEVDFTIEKENGDLLSKIYKGEAYTSDNTKVTMKTATVYAATSDMLIEELVQGSNFQELWKGKEKKEGKDQEYVTYTDNPASNAKPKNLKIYSQAPVEEQLAFLEQWRLSVGLLSRNWVSGLVNGTSDDGSKSLGGVGVIDSDRHSGNWIYNPVTREVSIIDYGTITKLDRQQRAAMVNLTAAIFAGHADGVIDNLAELMRPADMPVKKSHTATEFLRKRNEPHRNDPNPSNPKRTLTTDIKDAILKRSEEERHEDLLGALKNIGFLTADTTPENLYRIISKEKLKKILDISDKKEAAQDIIGRLTGPRQPSSPTELTEIEKEQQKNLREYLETDSGNRLFNVAKPNGSTQSRWLPVSLSDANGELYFIRTIQKIANVLTEYNISAPKSIVQLNRGTSFMRNHLHKNGYLEAVDDFLKTHKAELLRSPDNHLPNSTTELKPQVDAKFKAMEAKLKHVSLGDNFLSALLPQGMNTAMAVASQLAQPAINFVDSKMGISDRAKSSYQIVANICALAEKAMRGIDQRLAAAGAVAAVGAATGAVAYYNGDVTGLANQASGVLADIAGQSGSMLTDFASSMRSV